MTDADREAFLALEAERRRPAVAPHERRVGRPDEPGPGGEHQRQGRPRRHPLVPGRLGLRPGRDYLRNARWFRDQIRCRTVHLVWGNHDDRKIRDLFPPPTTRPRSGTEGVRMTLNHYPMLTWNGQHHGIGGRAQHPPLRARPRPLPERPESSPLKDADAWPALDVGFDGHDYQVWSLEEILDRLRPRLEAFEALKRERQQFDPFRGRGTVSRRRPRVAPRSLGSRPDPASLVSFIERSEPAQTRLPSFLTSSVNSASPSRRVWSGSTVSALSPIRSAVPEDSPSDPGADVQRPRHDLIECECRRDLPDRPGDLAQVIRAEPALAVEAMRLDDRRQGRRRDGRRPVAGGGWVWWP